MHVQLPRSAGNLCATVGLVIATGRLAAATNTGPKSNLLPEGEAIFTVVKLDRTRKDFGKFGTINVAVVKLMASTLVEGSDAAAEITVQLGLHHDLDWKITQFFTALGQRKHGDEGNFVPSWGKIVGQTGRCKITHRTYAKKDDKDGAKTGVANEIAEFLAPEEAPDNLKF